MTADRATTPALATIWEAPDVLPLPLAAVVVSEAGGAVAMAPTPPVWAVVVPVSTGALLPRAFAAARKLEKVWLPVVGGLIAPTIPDPQCVNCLQWNQMGSVLVTLMVNVDAVTRPESKPTVLELLALPAKYVHGLANVD